MNISNRNVIKIRYKEEETYTYMENWKDTFINQVPKDVYTVKLSSGEQDGLNIVLYGEKMDIRLKLILVHWHLTELLMRDSC